MIGNSISHYRIIEKLGQGGMGEVFRADDINLGRQVAIKVIPDIFAGDSERLARFEREAKLLASLNHANIAAIHGLEEAGGKRFLVLELVEGQTLAERLHKGPLSVEEALEVCRQIAEGLEAAHERGILHRDLKPSNVKITQEGKVKILDFGLAKALGDETQVADATHSPTITEAMTRPGVVLGTAAYMSPEQAKGKPLDKRADVWAFGCILYECLTGRRAFEGETVTETLAAVVLREPDWSKLPSTTPVRVNELLVRCLKKDVRQRLHDIVDARLDMEELIARVGSGSGLPPITAHEVLSLRSRVWRLTPWILFGLALVAAAAAWLWRYSVAPGRDSSGVRGRFSILLPGGDQLADSSYRTLALAPDGSEVVFSVDRAGTRLLLRRPLDSLDVVALPGTEGGATLPFFSADGSSIGFFLPGIGMAAVPVLGGAMRTICESADVGGAAWQADGSIVFGGYKRGLSRCPPGSTKPEVLTSIDKSGQVLAHQEPQVLPDGRVLFVVEHVSRSEQQRQVGLLEPRTGAVTVIRHGITSPHYLTSGHLFHARSGALYVERVDANTLAPLGPPQRLIPALNDSRGDSFWYRHARYDVSIRGPLVYEPAPGLTESELAWADRSGALHSASSRRGAYLSAMLSPDDRRVVIGVATAGENEIWTLDLERDVWVRLSYGVGHGNPSWTRDGKRVMFASNRGGPWTIHTAAVDATGAPQPLPLSINLEVVGSAPVELGGTGGIIFMAQGDGIGLYSLQSGTPTAIRLGPPKSVEFNPRLSPDGRWLAYISRDSGGRQLYVRDFPPVKIRSRISTDGADDSAWAADGRVLYFRNGGRIMAVSVQTQPTFSASRPQVLVEIPGLVAFDVAKDGRILVVRRISPPPTPQLVVIPDWRAILPIGDREPTRR